jgi:glycosyltransferase involved in cell wall biosynthesis
MPRVSICVPTCNRPELLKRALQSIFSQEYADFEVVINDNSSDDSSGRLVESFSQNRLRYHKNPIGLPPTENWNTCLDRAQGELVKVLFDDDWFVSPRSLGRMVELMDRSPGVGFAFGASHNIGESKQWVSSVSSSRAKFIFQFPQSLFWGNFIGSPSATIFRKGPLRFDPKLKWLVDLEFYIRCLLENPKVEFTTEPLVFVGINDGQVTNSCHGNNRLNIFEYSHVFLKHQLREFEPCKKHLIHIFARFNASLANVRAVGLDLWDFLEVEVRKVKIHGKRKYLFGGMG